MSPQVFTIFSSLIEERIGLHYGSAERELLLYKLADRAAEAGFDSILDYYYHLRYDDPNGVEQAALTDALVVNETFFFRERAALEQVIAAHIAPLCGRKPPPRIWCAASSSGEEPYTLALTLESVFANTGVDWRVLATDISRPAICSGV